MAASLDGTNGLTFNDGTLMGSANSLGMRNRIINGDMRIDQRNAGAAVTVGSGAAYVVDRWNGYNDLLNTTGQQSTIAPAGFTNSIVITVGTGATPTAGQIGRLEQRIEGFNVADLAWGTSSALAVTVSFWVRSSVTGTHSGATTNTAGNRSYPFTFIVSVANTFEYKTVTIPGDTSGTWLKDNGVGLILKFNLGSGNSWLAASGAWASTNAFGSTGSVNLNATSGATFYITGVQLEEGSVATPFERRPIGLELALCQRYFEVLTNIGGGTGYMNFMHGGANTTSQATVSRDFCVTKRASPSFSFSGAIADFAILYNGGSNPTTSTSMSLFGANLYAVELQINCAAVLPLASYVTLAANNTISSGRLNFSSEL